MGPEKALNHVYVERDGHMSVREVREDEVQTKCDQVAGNSLDATDVV